MADPPGLATLTAPGVGSISAWSIALGYSVQVSAQEDASRDNRGYYPTAISVPNFSVTFAFRSWAEGDQFLRWLINVGARCASPTSAQQPVVVAIPSSGFLRSGVPASGMAQGDQFGTLVYSYAVTFTGTTNPVTDLNDTPSVGVTPLTPGTTPVALDTLDKSFHSGKVTSGAQLFFPTTTPGAGDFPPTRPLIDTLEAMAQNGTNMDLGKR